MNSVRNMLFFFFLFAGCKERDNSQKIRSQKTECHAYFSFDEADYYHIEISENESAKLGTIENPSASQELKREIVIDDMFSKMQDTALIANLKDLGFQRTYLPKASVAKLRDIFCERDRGEVMAMTCIPTYRDILFFRHKGKIVGTAKICFDCLQSIIVGAHVNTDNFGEDGDWGELSKVLSPKPASM